MAADDWRHTNPRFQAEALAKNLALAEHVKRLAADKGCTPAQVAIAWVLAQGNDIVPIPGTKRVQYLDDNLGAAQVTLTSGERAELDRLFPPGVAEGERYAAGGMRMVE
jgi:aryl-alcohol dehydrogenase-like predicted oxidoreductase